MTDKPHPTRVFKGFRSPNYTQVPDELFDELMVDLSGAELKVLLYIIRRTFGFKKESDTISISQMLHGIEARDGRVVDRGVGLSKKTLLQALRTLQDKALIVTKRNRSTERGNEPSSYSLNMTGAPLGGETTPPLGEKVHQGVGGEITPSPRGKNSPIQQTVLQQTDISSNIRRAAQGVDNSDAHPQAWGDNTHAPSNKQPISPLQDTTKPQAPVTPTNGHETRGGETEALGAILKRQRVLVDDSDAREAVASYIKDIAVQFGDKAKLKSSVTRAYNLYEQSGRTLHGFVDALFLARANVKERQDSTTQEPIQNRMSYFFSVLEDQLGLKAEGQAQGQGESATGAGSKSPQSLSPPD